MLKKLYNVKAAIKNNKGSGILTMLVTMFFLSILGVTVLYMSVVGLRIKTTERRGVENHYSTTELMEIIKIGLQEAVSDTIDVTYSQILLGEGSGDFGLDLYTGLSRWIEPNSAYHWRWAFLYAGTVNGYNAEAFATFLIKAGIDKELIAVNGTNYQWRDGSDLPIQLDAAETNRENSSVIPVRNHEGFIDKIIFRDLTVTYTNPETNVTTSITSDIVINIPEVVVSANSYNISGINNFAMIARDEFTMQNAVSDLVVSGSMSAESVNFNSVANLTTTLRSGELVTPGTITIGNNNILLVEDANPTPTTGSPWTESTVWSREIVLENNAVMTMQGEAFVADDLMLNGQGSAAVLEGNYYGFGTNITDPSQSSSIVMNGRATDLRFGAESNLTLAGHSFITQKDETATGVLMGESVSIRTNQLAYLVPTSELNTVFIGGVETRIDSNPYLTNSSALPPTPTSTTGEKVVALSETIRTSDSSMTIVYYFYDFSNDNSFDSYSNAVNAANNYFIDKFEDGDTVTEYIENFINQLSALPTQLQTSGYTIGTSNINDYYLGDPLVGDALTQKREEADNISNIYDSLYKTLLTNSTNTADTLRPYEYILDENAVNNFMTSEPNSANIWNFYNSSNEVVAVLVRGSVSLSALPDTVRIVITTDEGSVGINTDVTVDRNYDGLIVSGGDIAVTTGHGNPAGPEIVNSIESDPTAVNDAFSSIYTNPTTLVEYTFGDFMALFDGVISSNSSSWNASDLVVYENWSKN